MGSNKRTYLLSVFISAPATKHEGIKSAIDALSDGEYEFLHLHKMGVFAVVNSNHSADAILNAVQQATMSDDRVFICSLGNDWQTYGLNKAAFWLKGHLQPNS